MKHRLLFTLLLGLMSIGASAQDYTIKKDLSSKITNANFSMDTPVTTTIRTYDYDMPDNGAGSGEEGAKGLFGMQPVVGWTASTPTDNTKVSTDNSSGARTDGLNAKACGVFAYDDESGEDDLPGLGGTYYPPFLESDLSGNTLGMVAVWGASLSYTQDVSLPKGAYMLEFKVYNQSGTGTLSANNFGYVVSESVSFLSEKTTFDVGVWETFTVVFRLEEDTNGKISMGLGFGSGSGSAPHIFVDNVKLYEIDEGELDQEEINKKKEELWSLIEIGKAYGVDTSASEAVYNNPNATMAEVESAIEAQKALNDSGVTDLSEAFITNPHFTQDDPIEGGICTYDYDCEKNGIPLTNYSMLPVTGWSVTKTDNGAAAGVYEVGQNAFLGGAEYLPPTTLSDGVTTEGKVLGFVTCWSMSVQYKQSVSLPAGSYTLTLSYYNTGGANAVAKNLIGFIADDGTEYLGTRTQFPVGTWTSENVSFELTEETTGYFSLGYTSTNTGSGNMPHFFTDGIYLTYIGTGIDASFLALQSAVKGGETLLEENFNASLKSAFEEVVSDGRDLVNSQSHDQDANRAATEAIKSQLEAVNSSIKAYQKLEEFYNGDLADALDKYETTEPSLYNEIGGLNDRVAEALDEFNWTNEEIESAIAELPTIIKGYVQAAYDNAVAAGKHLDNDLDISVLFDNLGVTYSTSIAQGTSVPDKQWNYGDASNFKTQYGTAEVWNQSPFTVSQTMTDMPAGVYTLKVRAYYRTADNETNFASYNPDDERAFVFAGGQKTALCNVAEIASVDPEEFINPATVAETNYIPNSQEAAHAIFENSNYDDKLLKSVSTVLVEDGDLTFGITAEQMEGNSWVVWYTFELYYNALDGNDQAITDELESLLVTASNYINDGCSNVIDVLTNMGDKYDEGEKALNEGSVAERIQAIKDLKSAIAEADESAKLVEELSTTRDMFETLQSESDFESGDTKFEDLLANASSDQYESNESIREMINRFPAAWANYVLGQDMSDASEDNPIDITGIILNHDFETENVNYWTFDPEIGQNQGYQGANYSNEDGSIIIDKFVEAWRNNAILNNGDISQTLAAVLPEGYYMLEVDGQALNQGGLPEGDTEIYGASLMAKVGNSMNLTSMAIEGTVASPAHFAIGFYSDGKSPVTVGLHIEDTNANWISADNFTLSYIGSEAPTAIETIKNAEELLDLNNAVIYNLSGQRLNHVQRGINIINGKKVYIK